MHSLLTANFTLKRLFPAVDALMIVQGGELLECPPANSAGMGLHLAVVE